MRWTVLLVLLLLAPLPVTAQSSTEPVLTDAAGDVTYLVAEEQTVPAADDHGPADILALTIDETHDALTFGVDVADVDQFPEGSGQWMDSASLDVRFRVGDLFYNVRTGMYQDGQPFGELRGGQADFSEPIIETNMEAFLNGTTFSISIDRKLLRDHNGAPVQTGMQLTDIWVDSHVHATGLFLQNADGSLFQPLGIRDRMPDTGTGTFDVLLGGPLGAGPMLLETPTPFRASNGGEATIVYTFVVHNQDTQDAVFDAHVTGFPSNWEVTHLQQFSVPAGDAVQASIVVTTPFGHNHGGTEEFTVHVERTDDSGTWAQATMGILYLAIPQPAGHHDTVFFHSTSNSNVATDHVVQTLGGVFPQPWMDTLQENPEDQGAAIIGTAHQNLFPTTGYSWWVCLRPHLQLGLDVNMSKTGTLSVPLSASRPMTGSLTAELVHFDSSEERLESCTPAEMNGRTETLVATAASDGSADINGGHTFELDLLPNAAADFIPYAPGTDLVFRIDFHLDADEPPVAGPYLEPGGVAKLPLDEYFDERPAGIVLDEEGPAHEAAKEIPDEEKSTPAVFIGGLAMLALAAYSSKRTL